MSGLALQAAAGSGPALDVVELVARTGHVAALVLWVGLGWWDAWILAPARARAGAVAEADARERARDATLAGWLRWSSLVAAGLGVVLLFLVYYGSRTAYLTGALPEAGDWMTALLALAVATGAYEVLARVPARLDAASLLGAGAVVLGYAWVCSARLGFSERGAYVHAGVLLGTLAASNTWAHVAPALERLGGEPDAGPPRPGDAELAARRARHGAAFALAALPLMLGAGQAGLFGHAVLPTLAVILVLAWATAAALTAVARIR